MQSRKYKKFHPAGVSLLAKNSKIFEFLLKKPKKGVFRQKKVWKFLGIYLLKKNSKI